MAICKWLDIPVFSDMDHKPYALCSQPKTGQHIFAYLNALCKISIKEPTRRW